MPVARFRRRPRMLPKNSAKRLCERLVPFTLVIAVPVALCAAFAQAREMDKSAPSPSPVPSADEALIPALPANLERLPAPAIAPPVNRKKPASVHVELEARPVTGLLAEGIGYH